MPVRQQRPTLRDVAEEAGVSKTTAVFVINERPGFSIPEETRSRVLNAAKRLGYRRNGLAAALSRGRTGSIGLVLNTVSDWRSPTLGDDYLLGVILGATQAAASAGLRLTTISFAHDNPPSPDEVTDSRVDGLILVGILDEVFSRAIYASGFPCVTLGSGYARWRITADNIGGAKQAVEHLIGLGHTRIAYASPRITHADRERQQGWTETMERHGLPTQGLERDWEPLREWLLSDDPDRPTAVFCRNDGYASFLIRSLRHQGVSVPKDLSVVGFDSGVIAEAMDLTSVRNPLSEQTIRAVDILNQLIAGGDPPTTSTLPTELNLRYSTLPLPQSSHSRKEF